MTEIDIRNHTADELEITGYLSHLTVEAIYPEGEGRYLVLTKLPNGFYIHSIVAENGTNIHPGFCVRPKKPSFIFPQGIGEAIGKEFRTRAGYRSVCIGDFRVFDIDKRCPLFFASKQVDCRFYTCSAEGTYYETREANDWDIVDYWED